MTVPHASPTFMLRAYRGATYALAPFVWWLVRRKLKRAEVPLMRQWERLGHATAKRPPTRLIWIHGASVGESLSALTLIEGLSARLPRAEFLVTSGTPTSADLVNKRQAERTRHQFAPLDALGPVTRFLDHWNPDAAIFVESELWPLTLHEAHMRSVPLALVNARLSARSVDGWCKYPKTAGFVISLFHTLIAQNREAADNLRRMGADPARITIGGNLKGFASAPAVDETNVRELEQALDGRPRWAACSTHPGEEKAALNTHIKLLVDRPDLCLLLIPRHPERGDEVAQLITQSGLTFTRRSSGESPTAQVYLADTLGELPLWYALSPFVFLGGSLAELGGHNPFEPAQAGAAILTGPHVFNFAESFTPLLNAGGAIEVTDAEALYARAVRFLTDAKALEVARTASARFAKTRDGDFAVVLDRLIEDLELA